VRTRGFTLVELLLVLAIIAIAMLLGAGVIGRGMDGLRLRSSANGIAAQLRFTRAQALATGEPQRFTIDPAAHAWQAPKERHGTVPARAAIGFTGAREAQPTEGLGAIVFFPDGASTGGRVRLQQGAAAWQVDVAWLTGQVAVVRVR
jgi:general secretion pathway protein H